MSQHNFQEINKGNENTYQSVWMAHWMRSDFDATQPRFDVVDNQNNAPGPSKQIEQINTSTTLEIVKESVRGVNLKNKQPCFQPLPVNSTCTSGPSSSRLQKDKETRGSQRSYTLSRLQEGKPIRGTSSCLPKSVASANEISSGPSKSQKSVEKMKEHAFISNNSYVESRPTSGLVLYQSGSGKSNFEFGRSGMSSHMGGHFVHANDQFPGGEVKQSLAEPFHCTIRSPNFLGNSSMMNYTSSRKTSTSYHRLGSLKDPSTSANRTSVSRDHHLPLQTFPNFRQLRLPSHGSSELTRLEKFHDGYSTIPKLPPLIPRVEALRSGANVDSRGGSSGCFPIFSRSNRSMLVTRNTDVNAYLSSSSPFLHHGHQGVKIQSLCSSTDSEGNRNHEDSKDSEGNLKNASSAETDAMDMDPFTERCHTSGVNQSSFMKALKSKPIQFSGDRPGTEIGNSELNSDSPDKNLELSAANNKTEGAVSSFSKTQSLDMDTLQAYPARTNNSISSPCLSIFMKSDSTGRWAKRLKSSATDIRGVGTQSFDLEEVSRNKMKRPSVADKANAFEIKNVTTSKVETKRGKDLLLSQSWIQRWLRNDGGTREKQLEPLVLCEPQSSKLALDDLDRKQFPSIAAMALMGKAMNGFRPCELQNRGPFVVWN